EDDQQAAEEDAHRSREAGEQGEAAEAEALNPARVAPAVPQRRGSPRAAWGPRGYGPRPRLYTCSKSALSGAVDGFAVDGGVPHVIVLRESERRRGQDLPRFFHHHLPRDPGRGLE